MKIPSGIVDEHMPKIDRDENRPRALVTSTLDAINSCVSLTEDKQNRVDIAEAVTNLDFLIHSANDAKSALVTLLHAPKEGVSKPVEESEENSENS